MDYARQFCPPNKAAKAVGRMKRAVQAGWEITAGSRTGAGARKPAAAVRKRGRQGRAGSLPGEASAGVQGEVMISFVILSEEPSDGSLARRRSKATMQ